MSVEARPKSLWAKGIGYWQVYHAALEKRLVGRRMRYTRTLAIAKRHGRLVELIRVGAFSSPDLARKLKVSEQTIYRDVDFLKHRGYAIRAEKHADGWAYHLLAEAAVANGKGSEQK